MKEMCVMIYKEDIFVGRKRRKNRDNRLELKLGVDNLGVCKHHIRRLIWNN
jgi:hypothetical protein